MAYIDVGAWSPEHVVYWMRGLHGSLEKESMNQFIRQRVNGIRLMLLGAQDIIDLLPTIKVEALQAVVQGMNSLRALNFNSNLETLQSLTLNLACHAKYLYNQLIQAEQSPRILPVSTTSVTPMTGGTCNASKNRFDFAKIDSNMQLNQSTKQRVSLETLDSVSIIVDQIAHVVNWLNSTGLTSDLSKFNKDFKSIVLRIAIELTSTAQRDQFVDQPNEILKKTSKFLADYCEWVVCAIDDPDFIQPCWLDVVSVKKKADEEDFGVRIQPVTLMIEEIVFSSPAHRSGRITVSDEIIQVDYQTVLGWPLGRVEQLIRTYQSEVILTLKKKPVQPTLNPSIVIIKPYAIPLKRILSHSSESRQTTQDESLQDISDGVLDRQSSFAETNLEQSNEDSLMEPPKEPKGPVYPGIKAQRSRRELKRRTSISGDISDALVDLSLADSLPIPSLDKPESSLAERDKSKPGRITKETLTKSVSHDTAKLYLHTLSIDRKHLWLPRAPEAT